MAGIASHGLADFSSAEDESATYSDRQQKLNLITNHSLNDSIAMR